MPALLAGLDGERREVGDTGGSVVEEGGTVRCTDTTGTCTRWVPSFSGLAWCIENVREGVCDAAMSGLGEVGGCLWVPCTLAVRADRGDDPPGVRPVVGEEGLETAFRRREGRSGEAGRRTYGLIP